MRKRAKVDSTHGPIVEAFRKGGWRVRSLATLGDGMADLLVKSKRYADLYLIECKTGTGKLRPDQVEFAKDWPVHVLRSVEDALAFMKGR